MSLSAAAQPVGRPDPLYAIDRARDAVVDRIVERYQSALTPQGATELRTRLWTARADHLFAASLARSLDAVYAMVGDPEHADAAELRVDAKAIGDANADLVYTPITPCRIADTRKPSPNPLLANTARMFVGFSADFSTQGGTASNCGMPNGVAAIAMNVYAVNATTLGFIKVYAGNQAEPAVSTVNYQSGFVAIATGAIVPVDAANNNQFIAKSPAQIDFIADVVGYFAKPNGTPFKQAGNAFGTTAVLGTTDAQPLELWQGNKRVMRYESGPNAAQGNPFNLVAGNAGNTAASVSGAVIAGGGCNTGTCTIGNINKVINDWGVISGGNTNTAWFFGVVGGGFANYAAGSYSVVPGGSNNISYGAHSFAAGFGAVAQTSPAAGNVPTHGAFVWADSANNAAAADVFYAAAIDEFAARARGGFRFRTSGGDGGGSGCNLPAGSGTFSCTSDRNAKRDFAPVDPDVVLDKVAALPVTTWRFNGNPAAHMGPMAQDFWRAFGLGDGDTTISHVDVQGVTIAAIQGLAARGAEKDLRIERLEREVAALQAESARTAALRDDVAALRAALQVLVAERATAASVTTSLSRP